MDEARMVELFRVKKRLYRKDPVLFAGEVIKYVPDQWQADTLHDLADPTCRRVSVRSGQGVGKTATEAVALLWFLSCFPYARVVATAPTRQQLNDVLWSEVAKWQAQSPLLSGLLKWTKTYVYVVGMEKRWFAVARTATKPENMQGFHEENMLFIVDEASGVAEPIMEAVLGTLSGPNNKLLMCGNPTKTNGTFYDSHTNPNVRPLYRVRRVSSRDVSRTDKENIEMLERRYGKESNVVRVRVDGEFPLQEDDVFIPIQLAEASVNRELEKPTAKISLGVDVARFGDDETIIAQNAGGDVTLPVIRHGQNLMRTVGDIVQQYRRILDENPNYYGTIPVIIDDTGLGGGVTDRLTEVRAEQRLSRMEIIPVNFGGKIPDKEAAKWFGDITSYMWSIVRDRLSDGTLKLPDDSELIAQLSVRKYALNSSGKIVLESKKEMKKRGLFSPDRADAVALSCFLRKTAAAVPPEDPGGLAKESYWRR
ncbi:MAG: terminase B [Ruminiclostridium sp.]|nr:terminase B [Ruminiclostridium sp.]